jgi:hypothetical protein
VTGDGTDAYRAVATEHQGGLVRSDGFSDAPSGLAHDPDNRGQILGAPVLSVRAPAPCRPILVVAHDNAGLAQQLDQARLSERPRRLLLTGGEGAGAGGYTDQPQGSTQLFLL